MYRMYRYVCLVLVICLATLPQIIYSGGVAPGDTVVIISSGKTHSSSSHNTGGGGTNGNSVGNSQSMLSPQQHHHQQPINTAGAGGGGGGAIGSKVYHHHLPTTAGSGHIDHRNSYNLLSEAMSQAVSHEFSSLGSGSADGACHVDDLDCYSGNIQDRLGMEAIRSLHRQLDDDDNGNIDLSESDDFLREELKYDSGYEKRQKAFHFNDDMHISVKELWEAWLRSEVHNWTIEQTTDWLAQSVQLPQYVDLFKQHKVAGAALPRLAVNNMHYVSNVLGIKDPIHKQKIALKAMDVVLFGPPRETGTRWKDYILVTLLLSAIIGCWYAYQQNKNAKRHLRRMAQDMEGLQRAEVALQEMQKELELARMAQENVATEKLDLERRLKEAPSLSSSNSDLELLQLKQEIEMLRNELSRAEIELVDHCWSPPAQLKSWLQYTYELENKYHLQKRIGAEKQLQCAREACEKLRKKRTSLVGAFVSTHGKSIDDVDRSIVEARNSLSEVTMELQERVHRWKQIEQMLGFQIANNNGLAYLENVLYNRNGAGSGSSGGSVSGKNSRGRLTNSTDDLDDDSVQGMGDNYNRNSIMSDRGGGGGGAGAGHYGSSGNRDDSSDDGDNQSVNFYLGSNPGSPSIQALNHLHSAPSLTSLNINNCAITDRNSGAIQQQHNSHLVFNSHESAIIEDKRSPSVSSERSVPLPPRNKKQSIPISSNQQIITSTLPSSLPPPPPTIPIGRTPLPPPRRLTSQQSQQQFTRTQSTDTVPLEHYYPINSCNKTSSRYSSIPVITNNSGTSAAAATTTTAAATTAASTTATTTATKTAATTTTATTTTISSNATGTNNVTTSSSSSSIASTFISSITTSFNTKFSSSPTTTATPISAAFSFINTDTNNSTTATTNGTTTNQQIGRNGGSKFYTIIPTKHSDTKQQIDDTISSTDSSSIGGDEQKKRRRKLRFPFGKSKSNKNKLA